MRSQPELRITAVHVNPAESVSDMARRATFSFRAAYYSRYLPFELRRGTFSLRCGSHPYELAN